MRKDNRGMSLVELLIATAILSVVMLGVGMIMVRMSNMFSMTQKEVQLQDNVQSTYSILSNLIKESQVANKTLSTNTANRRKSVVTNGDLVYIFDEDIQQSQSFGDSKTAKADAKYYLVDFDRSKNKLYLFEGTYDAQAYGVNTTPFNQTTFMGYFASGSGKATAYNSANVRKINNLLANNVTDLKVADHLVDGYVTLFIKMEYGNRSAEITQNVYLRNSNIASNGVITDTTTPTMTGTVTPTPTSAGEEVPLDVVEGAVTTTPVPSQINNNNDIIVRFGKVNEQNGTKTVEWDETVRNVTISKSGSEISIPQSHEELESIETVYEPIYCHKECYVHTIWDGSIVKENGNIEINHAVVWAQDPADNQWKNMNVVQYKCSNGANCKYWPSWNYQNVFSDSEMNAIISDGLNNGSIFQNGFNEIKIPKYKTVEDPPLVVVSTEITETVNGTSTVSHSENVPKYTASNAIVIQNDSANKDYTGVDIIVYYKNGARFKKNSGKYLNVCTSLSSGHGNVTVSPSDLDGSGNAKYLTIHIPTIKQAYEVTDPTTGQKEYAYDQYVFYCYPTNANDVLCTYSVTTE